MKPLRIGTGAGSGEGDRIDPAPSLAERGALGVLVFECLADRSIALARLHRSGDPHHGYDPQRAVLERAVAALRDAGVPVDEGARPGFEAVRALALQWQQLFAATSPGLAACPGRQGQAGGLRHAGGGEGRIRCKPFLWSRNHEGRQYHRTVAPAAERSNRPRGQALSRERQTTLPGARGVAVRQPGPRRCAHRQRRRHCAVDGGSGGRLRVDETRARRPGLRRLAYDVLLDTDVHIQPLPSWMSQWVEPSRFANPGLIRAVRRDGVAL